MIGTADSEPNSIFVFTGRVLDEHVGLQPTLNRQFDVAVGCWLNDEPVGYQGDGDLYRYASNRLVAVIHRTSEDGPILQSAEYVYDSQNRWIAKSIDADGAGPEDATSTYFVYDGNQIVLQIGAEGQVTNRYLWGPAVDQVLADEQLQFDGSSAVLWTLTDHLNTVRDLAVRDAETGVTTIANHVVYDAFGRVTSQTDPGVMTLFGFTARPFDRDTGLQNNLNRWYDAETGTWISEDPKGFAAADANLYRYCENDPINRRDPTGTELPPEMLQALQDLAESKNWTREQLAAAKQWLENLLTTARNMPRPSGWDQCWKWAGSVISKVPGPPNADIGVRLQAWYYPAHWNPLVGYLTHATVQIKIGDEVFYIDNGTWGDKPGTVYRPNNVSPRVKPFDIQSPPPDPLWWQCFRIGMQCGTFIYTPRF